MSGWIICAHCAPYYQQFLQKQYYKSIHENNNETKSFPHLLDQTSTYTKNICRNIDAYTASFMRWSSKEHVRDWLLSFDCPEALRPVFIDTETTGMHHYSEIIEVAIVDEIGRTCFHTLVKPKTMIEPNATQVHHITQQHVSNAPLYEEIFDDMMFHLLNKVVIAYHASFDIRLLKQTADIYHLSFPRLHIGCLMHAYAKFRALPYKHYKTYRLEEALKKECIEISPTHHAEKDAYCVYRLFYHMKMQCI
jgi:DNA polymerase-3 subunit epsilon